MMFRSQWLLTLSLLSLGMACAKDQPTPTFEAARVLADVEAQCAFGPRIPGTAARDSVAAMISRRIESYGGTVNVQAFQQEDPWVDGSFLLINIIASFEPDRPRRVMLASHYDSRPWADNESDSTLHDQPVMGAVDGATSSAILLEMARVLSQQMPDDIGIDLVFFDGEDYGRPSDYSGYCLGSKYFAGNLGGYRPVCAIVLDMVGGVGTRIAKEAYSTERSGALVDTLFARAAHLDLDAFLQKYAGGIYDDHVPLLQAGFQAVDLFGYDYEFWHTLNDTPDKVDVDLVDQVGRLLVNFLFDFPL